MLLELFLYFFASRSSQGLPGKSNLVGDREQGLSYLAGALFKNWHKIYEDLMTGRQRQLADGCMTCLAVPYVATAHTVIYQYVRSACT